jgi:hypothetical protein
VLILAPWYSQVWDHNRFVQGRPVAARVVGSSYVRGAVTGVGVITAVAGVAELGSLILSRARRRAPRQQT